MEPAPTIEHDAARERLVAAVMAEHAADQEAREALMALVVRVVDEMRVGLRPVDVDELRTLAGIWSDVNGGVTPAEIALRHLSPPA